MNSNSDITKEDCLKVLDIFSLLYSNSRYQFANFKVVPLGSEPLGFLGDHSKLLITVSQSYKYLILQFFMKTIPNKTEAHKNYISNIGVCKKEALLYKNILRKLQQLVNLQFAPVCFLVNHNFTIVLEDLGTLGYSVIKDKSLTLDYNHCKCCIKTIANFHASSIIFEEKHSSEFEPYRINNHFNDILFETTYSWDEGNARSDWLKITKETLISVCKKMDDYKNKDVATKLNQYVENMKEFIKPSKKYRNVINHGDLWSNNIMFQYNENNVPINCILIDFQMARYVPPCFDFTSFLYLTTTKEFHQKYFSELVDIYYNTFTAELIEHNINPDKILTKTEFLESCEYYKSATLLEAAMFGTIVYLNGDFSKDMLADEEKFEDFMKRDRSKLVCKLFDEDEVYRARLESVISQLLDHIL